MELVRRCRHRWHQLPGRQPERLGRWLESELWLGSEPADLGLEPKLAAVPPERQAQAELAQWLALLAWQSERMKALELPPRLGLGWRSGLPKHSGLGWR